MMSTSVPMLAPSGPPSFAIKPPKKVNDSLSYDVSLKLGTGSSSIVYKGNFKGQEVAVKQMKDKLTHNVKKLIRDIMKIKHENIVQILAIETDKPHCEHDYIVLELCLASLYEYYEKRKTVSSKFVGLTVVKKVILQDAVKGLEHLHKNNIIHRDIKPGNILLVQKSSSSEVKAVLVDFGISAELIHGQKAMHTFAGRGTLTWMAPELISDVTSEREFSCESDVFSMGCVMYYVETEGNHPFDTGDGDIHLNVKMGKQCDFNLLSDKPKAKEIIFKMIRKEIHSRPKAITVLEDPYFKKDSIPSEQIEGNNFMSTGQSQHTSGTVINFGQTPIQIEKPATEIKINFPNGFQAQFSVPDTRNNASEDSASSSLSQAQWVNSNGTSNDPMHQNGASSETEFFDDIIDGSAFVESSDSNHCYQVVDGNKTSTLGKGSPVPKQSAGSQKHHNIDLPSFCADDDVGPVVDDQEVLDFECKDIDQYKMNTSARGYCLVISMRGRVDKKYPNGDREPGNNEDVKKLRSLFKGTLKFAFKVYKDFSKSQIDELMEKVHEADHSWSSCFVMFILAHGDTNKDGGAVFETCDKVEYRVSTIKERLETTESLNGTPKLLFLQSCRGTIDNTGVYSKDQAVEGKDQKIPFGSDFFVSFATIKGHFSYRNHKGSPFIRHLWYVFNTYHTEHDVVSMMTIVAKRMSVWSGKANSETDKDVIDVKQIPEFISTLRKFLYFVNPKEKGKK